MSDKPENIGFYNWHENSPKEEMENRKKWEEINRNPPAFPRAENGISFQTGMSLRDYFAAEALPAIITMSEAKLGASWKDCIDASGTLAYLIADAMLKARGE